MDEKGNDEIITYFLRLNLKNLPKFNSHDPIEIRYRAKCFECLLNGNLSHWRILNTFWMKSVKSGHWMVPFDNFPTLYFKNSRLKRAGGTQIKTFNV